MKISGMTIMIVRWILSIVADMKYVDAIWLPGVDRQEHVADQCDVVPVRRCSGRSGARRGRRPAGVLREVLQDEIERDEDRELGDHRQARGRRVDVVLPVELHHLLVLLLLVALVLLLDLLHLRRVTLHRLHRVDLPHRQRHEADPDDDVVATIDQAQGRPKLWKRSSTTEGGSRAAR